MSPLPLPDEKLDPRVRRTLRALEQALADLLSEKGFNAISVQDVTERAGLNRATFYAHFADKYALLTHSIRRGFLHEIETRMLDACHYTRDNLRNLIVAVCEFTGSTSKHCKTSEVQFEALVEAQVKDMLYGLLMKWLEQAATRVPAEMAATAGSWAIYGLAVYWKRSKNRLPAAAFADEVVPLVATNFRLAQPA
jgi:AcrR family transcriptional regulator